MKTGSEREIVDCQAILNFLNRFNTHKVLWGRYCYSYCSIDEERKGQRSKVACPRSHRRTVEELEFAAQFWFLVDYQTQEQDSEEWKVSSLSQKKKKKKSPRVWEIHLKPKVCNSELEKWKRSNGLETEEFSRFCLVAKKHFRGPGSVSRLGGGHCMFALSRASDFWAFPTVSYISQQKG